MVAVTRLAVVVEYNRSCTTREKIFSHPVVYMTTVFLSKAVVVQQPCVDRKSSALTTRPFVVVVVTQAIVRAVALVRVLALCRLPHSQCHSTTTRRADAFREKVGR